MDILGAAFSAIERGLAPIVVIALIQLVIVTVQLKELLGEQKETNALLRNLGEKIDTHGEHQTSRMEEIRRFMLDWWERFAPVRRTE